MDAFKEIPTINFYNRSNSETHIQHTVGKSISFIDAPKRSCARNIYYAEESDSDENDHFHDNDDDRDGCYIPDIDCSDEESENVVEVVTEVDEEDDVEDALNNLCSDVEDLFVEDGGVMDEAPGQVHQTSITPGYQPPENPCVNKKKMSYYLCRQVDRKQRKTIFSCVDCNRAICLPHSQVMYTCKTCLQKSVSTSNTLVAE
ncbi:hypothetical protein FQR65_LT11854 [Abscondita terminalis]|nr:hypothetical protein FQR65_LT11854 [Abscondita terminalis]